MNRGSFVGLWFSLLLSFCCFHFRKQRDFSTLYGIYRRYGWLSKYRNDSSINNTYVLFHLFSSFSETFVDENWIVLNVIYEKFDPYKEKVDVRADPYKFWSKSYRTEVRNKINKQTNKQTHKDTEENWKRNEN